MGRLKHLQQGLRSFGHLPNTKVQRANEAYGFGGAEYWWDAAYGLNTSIDLGAVSFWVDRISNARWVQTTASAQPRLKLTSAINASYPSVESQGTGRFMQSVTGVRIPCFQKTIAFVVKLSTIGFFNQLLQSSDAATPTIVIAGTGAPVTGIGVYNSATGAVIVATTVENTNSHIVVVTPNGIIVDGVIQATGTINFTNPMEDLMGNRFSAGNALLGELGELLIYNRNLTNAQGVELCNNLNAKWAIY